MKRIVLILFCLVIPALCFAQGEENSLEGVPAKERIVTGGGFGLGFGSDQDFIMVSPSIGYMLTKKLMVGTGVSYRYTKYKIVSPAIKLNDYGINPFVRFTVYQNIFLQTEYEHLNYEFPGEPKNIRKTFDSFLAGGGYIQPLGGKVGFYILALYNFSYQDGTGYTPYASPLIVRAGITVGNFGF